MKKIHGISLIEFMLALTISALISSGIFTIFITAKNNYQKQLKLNQLQENTRIAAKIMSQDLALAGYIGCAKLTDHFPLINHSSFHFQNKITLNSHSITVMHADIKHAELAKPMHDNSILFVTDKPNFRANAILIISNCQSAEIFQVATSSLSGGGLRRLTAQYPLSKRYSGNYEISRLDQNTYFVAQTKHHSSALYQSDISHRKLALIENINALDIRADILHEGKLEEVSADQLINVDEIAGVSLMLSWGSKELKKPIYINSAFREK